jgi:hypothetical protein
MRRLVFIIRTKIYPAISTILLSPTKLTFVNPRYNIAILQRQSPYNFIFFC